MVTAKNLIVFSALLLASPAAAARDISGIRAMGMGEALRAMPAGTSAPLLNPAGMSLARMYVIGAMYQFRGSDSASQVHASIVDSVTAKLAAALAYTYVHASPTRTLAMPDDDAYTLEEKLQTHDVSLSLSMPLGDMFCLGVTGRYINHKGELPEDVPDGVTAADISTVTVDVGGIVRLGKILTLGVVGYNLADVEDTNYPVALGMGAAVQLAQMLLLDFDTMLDFSSADSVKPSFHGGAELSLASKYAIRAGVIHDRLREASYVTGGLGLNARKLELGFGLRQMVDGGAETLFGFSLQLLLQ